MKRRDFTKPAGAASVAALLIHHGGGSAFPERRQAILIIGESVRYDMLDCNLATGLRAPNFDRLAAQGVRFQRAYNCQPFCAACSRTQLLSSTTKSSPNGAAMR